jgi:hypothetical protein
MEKIEGVYYSYENKEDLDLSDVNTIRFNIDELNYIDVQFKNGKPDTLYINGSASIQIMPTASNCVEIKIKDGFESKIRD